MRNYKRVFSLLLAVMLIVSSINMTVFAVGEEETQLCTETVGCTKADACAAETHEEDCPKYAAPSASNKNDEPAAPAAPAEPTEPAAPAAPAEPTEPAVRSEAYQTVVALFGALPDASVITEETTDEEKAAIEAQIEAAMAAYEALSDEDYALFNDERAELLLAARALMDALIGEEPVHYADAVAQVKTTKGVTDHASLADAVAAAQPGDTVVMLQNFVNNDLSNGVSLSLKDGVTFDGNNYAIRGNAGFHLTINAGEKVTIKNVRFENIHNNTVVDKDTCDYYGWTSKTGDKSAIIASDLKGTLNVTNCTFDNIDWDAIQITPHSNSTINITGNTFKHTATDSHQLRYIHVEGVKPNFYTTPSVAIKINGNNFYATDNSNTSNITNIGIWDCKDNDAAGLTGNYFEYDPEEKLVYTNSEVPGGIKTLFPARSDNADLNPVAYCGDIAYLAIDIAPAATDTNGTVYKTLQEAINSVPNSSIIKLVKDIDETVTVPEGKSVAIRPYGNKMNGTITNNGSLTFDNGASTPGTATIVNNGTLTLSCGEATGFKVTNNGTLTFTYSDDSAYDVNNITNADGGKIVISPSSSSSKLYFTAEPVWMPDFYQVSPISEGKVKLVPVDDAAAVAAGAVARYNSATHYSRKYYKTIQEAFTNHGTVYLLTDVTGDITKNSPENSPVYLYCDGNTFTGNVICPGKTLSIYTGTAVIENVECGELKLGSGTKAPTITVKNGLATNITVAKNAKVTIEGGKYSGTITMTKGGTGSLTITGGNFVSDPAAYVDTTKYLVKNTAGAEYPYSVELRNETNSVARIGGTFYETLADALKAAQPGDTVKLLRNVTLENTITITKSVVLDLNTFTIDMTADGEKMFKDDGAVNAFNFEVKNGKLNTNNGRVFSWSNGGTLTLTGVTANAGGARVVDMYEKAGTLIIGEGTSVYSSGEYGIYLKGQNPTVQIYGEVSVGSDGWEAICVSGRAGGTPTIEVYDGATVSSSSVDHAAIQFGTSIKLKVVGGTLQGGDNAVEAYDDDDYENDVDITVVDGSFVSGGNIKGCIDIAGSPKFITGGVFSIRPKTAYLEDGLAVLLNDDAATKANYAFKIGVPPAAVTVIEVTEGAPEVSTGTGITSDKVAAASEAAKAITETDNKATMTIVPADSSKDDISKQATDIATNNTVKADDTSYQDENDTTQNKSIVDAVKETKANTTGTGTGGAVQQSDVTIVVQTYTDVQVADITVAGTTITEVKYDITPMAQKVATTTAIAEQAKIDSEAIKTTGDDKNAVKVGKPEKINVNAATMVTIPLPDNFFKTDGDSARQYYTNEEVYIKHVKEDGSTYTYKGKIVNETAPQRVYAVTFLNPHGFSEFTVSPTTNTVASITRDATTVYFETLQDAVDYVADNETIEITKNIDSAYVATVNRSVTFVVSNTTYTFDPAVNIRAGYSVNMTYNSATGTFTATYVPSYPYYPVEDPSADFWNDVESAIKNAKPGQTVKVNAKDFDKMPWQVMETLRTSDNVTLLITWNGGKDITIPASKALKKDSSFIYYPLSYLAELDFGTAEAKPETSDVVENTTPDTPQDTLPGEDKDQLNKPDASEGTQPAEPTRQAGNGLLIAGGLALLAVLALVITEIILRKRNKNA